MKKLLSMFLILSMFILSGCTDKKSSDDRIIILFYTASDATKIKTIELDESGFIEKPNNPERDGYEFEGWYSNVTLADQYKWDFDTMKIENTMTFYAKWKEGEYTLTFIPYGGSLKEGESFPTDYKRGDKTTFPSVSKRGYVFNGWYLVEPELVKPGEKPIPSVENQLGDLVLYAKFTAITVQVVFRNAPDGEEKPAGSVDLPSTITISYGTIIDFPRLNDTATHKFVGWFTQGGVELVNGVEFQRLSRTIVYAKWERI